MLQKNVLLKKYSNYKIGGPAQFFSEIKSERDIRDTLGSFYSLFPHKEKRPPIFILGEGTNVLIDDSGFPGLVIKNSINYLKLEGLKIISGAGVSFPDLLNFAIDNSLSGLQWAGGLPGSVGGAVRGNAGAFKGETKDSIYSVKSIEIENFKNRERSREECEFGYRMSIFKKKPDEIIIESVFELQRSDSEQIKKEVFEKIEYRKTRHPIDYPNIGSIFKNIPYEVIPDRLKKEWNNYIKDDPFPVVPVAKILSLANLKGVGEGDALISDKHPNFIVNLGNASSRDVRILISLIKKTVFEKYEIALEEEILIL